METVEDISRVDRCRGGDESEGESRRRWEPAGEVSVTIRLIWLCRIRANSAR